MTTGRWDFVGFEERQGGVVARFRGSDGDLRAIPVDVTDWLPMREDEERHPDPMVCARLVRMTAQFAALVRTAPVVNAHDRMRRPATRRGRAA